MLYDANFISMVYSFILCETRLHPLPSMYWLVDYNSLAADMGFSLYSASFLLHTHTHTHTHTQPIKGSFPECQSIRADKTSLKMSGGGKNCVYLDSHVENCIWSKEKCWKAPCKEWGGIWTSVGQARATSACQRDRILLSEGLLCSWVRVLITSYLHHRWRRDPLP